MAEKKELMTLDDVKTLVDRFYGKVRSDELLAPIFNERIRDRWPEHLEKMYRFWQTVLLGEHTYMGSPFPPHANLPVDKSHFDQWLKLFKETLDEFFRGEKANEAKWRADKMAEMFQLRLSYFREQGFKSII
ncbi:MAG TPA: group III truncated hemoglobin [Puia sp.]|jgi:hemoglobin|nr:group III truncated hemoglobin [Puia sp.]